MKFARYLEDTQIPEWKTRYIDYRKLKKCITQISKARASEAPQRPPAALTRQGTRLASQNRQNYGAVNTSPTPSTPPELVSPSPLELPPPSHSPMQAARTQSLVQVNSRLSEHSRASASSSAPASPSPPVRRFSMAVLRKRPSNRNSTLATLVPPTLNDIMLTATPTERHFFEVLDGELDKVEKFYIEREREDLLQSAILKEQLRELEEHHRLYHDTQPNSNRFSSFLPDIASPVRNFLPESVKHHLDPLARVRTPTGTRPSSADLTDRNLDPDEYHNAKKKLKKAVLEHYRGLELLNNYRILNLTGFRKALKKFDKVTKITALDPYMKEKVDGCMFSQDTKIQEMISSLEDLYAERFQGGDRKRARSRLRATIRQKTHHSSSFRSGLYIGLGVPALVQGIYFSFQEEARREIPAWAALLQVYGALLLPVVFALLISGNIIVWSRARINYVFIFELDVRTAIDPREFSAIPGFLFLTLSYAIWLSFGRIGASSVAPTTWPLAWLVFAIIFLVDPIPFFEKPSRNWFIKKLGKLLIPGKGRVEFTDFWMGDQLCSLAFTLSTLWTFGCAYQNDWRPDSFAVCGLSNTWTVPFALSILPSFIRFAQCVKRYTDTGLYTHMINGGKYLSSIIYYLFYYRWRHAGAHLHGSQFVLFCCFAVVMSSYTSGWDLLMDWSILKPNVPNRFLRAELVYTNYIPMYYFAIVTNVLIRFIWVFFFPASKAGLNISLTSFIFGACEILRRVQWNFFRLENEHLGNTDQYRVTREVPLPYTFDDDPDGEDDEPGSMKETKSLLGRSLRRRGRQSTPKSVHLPTVDPRDGNGVTSNV